MPEKKGQQAIFIVRTYMYFSMQENKKRHDMRLLADGCTSVCRTREASDPKDPDGDRGRAVCPGSRAIADTFVVATCGRALVDRDLVGAR